MNIKICMNHSSLILSSNSINCFKTVDFFKKESILHKCKCKLIISAGSRYYRHIGKKLSI
jgi:hypothetical protein